MIVVVQKGLLARDKRSSLFRRNVIEEEKKL
jgi:hypothetical protein